MKLLIGLSFLLALGVGIRSQTHSIELLRKRVDYLEQGRIYISHNCYMPVNEDGRLYPTTTCKFVPADTFTTPRIEG